MYFSVFLVKYTSYSIWYVLCIEKKYYETTMYNYIDFKNKGFVEIGDHCIACFSYLNES